MCIYPSIVFYIYCIVSKLCRNRQYNKVEILLYANNQTQAKIMMIIIITAVAAKQPTNATVTTTTIMTATTTATTQLEH